MDSHWGIAFFLFGKSVTPGESWGNRTAVMRQAMRTGATVRPPYLSEFSKLATNRNESIYRLLLGLVL